MPEDVVAAAVGIAECEQLPMSDTEFALHAGDGVDDRRQPPGLVGVAATRTQSAGRTPTACRQSGPR